MGEKQEKQADKTVKEEQPESTEWTPPSKEQYEELQKELDKTKKQSDTFKGLLKEAQGKGITKDDLSNIYTRIDDQQRWIGTALDDFKKGFGNDYEDRASRSYAEDAETHIKKANEGREKPPDPEAVKFFGYLADEELDFEDEFVQEAIKGTENVQDGLRKLKAAVKERDRQKILEDAKKSLDAERDKMREEILKAEGLTDTGAIHPSASGIDTSSMSPDEKLKYGFDQQKKKK